MKTILRVDSEPNGFTLTELLVVMVVISILAALLLLGLVRAKEQVRSVSCKNHLHQIGLAMQMYVSDHNIYPSGMGGGGATFKTWPDQLASYNPLNWTNVAWHCPTYIAEGGIVRWQPPFPNGGAFKVSGSYAYNARGMWGYQFAGSRGFAKGPWLGLGALKRTVHESGIMVPSEMYAIADTRPVQYASEPGLSGGIEMTPWQMWPSVLKAKDTEAKPPHSQAYNMLFADAHVSSVKRQDYLYPPRAARFWNRDHEPHPESWSPTNEWVIQN